MSVKFALKNISQKQQITIAKLLTFKEKEKVQSGYGYQKQTFYPKKMLRAFYKTDTHLYLPYDFVTRHIIKKPNPNPSMIKASFDFVKSLWDYQKPVCDEAESILRKKNSIILELYPSFGKTVIGAYFAAKFGYKTAIMLTSTNLLKSWRGTLKTFMPKAKVFLIQNKKIPPPDTDIYICMGGRIDHFPQDHIDQVGTLIIDECHQYGTEKRARILLRFRPKYKIALSATFERSDGFHRVIEEICGSKRIVIKNPKQFKVYRVSTKINTPIVSNNGRADWQALRDAISLNPVRNNLILKITKILLGLDRKILILTWLNENHVHVLLDMLKTEKIDYDYLSGSKVEYKDSRVLVGTISKIGTGFDEKETCDDFSGKRLDALIIAVSVKSTSLLEQMVGRVFRSESPIVVHLVDDDNISTSHWRGKIGQEGCRQWYLKNKGDIKLVRKIDIKNFSK